MGKIRMTAWNMVQVWNLLGDLSPASDNPRFTGWAKRLFLYMEPEVKLWNELSLEERDSLQQSELSFPVEKLKAEYLPDIITEEMADVLEPVIDGEITPYEPQLKKMLNGVKENSV